MGEIERTIQTKITSANSTYKKFVTNQKAIQSSVFHNTSELSGEFTMFVLPFPGTTLQDFETQMREAIAEFEKNGVSEEDITKFKAEYSTTSTKT